MKCNRCQDSDDYLTPDYLVEHFLVTGHPVCTICRRSLHQHEPRTCDGCVQRTRDTLADVADLYAELPDSLDRPAATLKRHPGGDPLVMLAWGSDGAYWSTGQPPQVAANDNWPSDPPSVAYTLARWEDDWRSTRGEPAATQPPVSKRRPASRINLVFRAALDYQQRHLQWAANNHPAFDEYAADLRGLRRALEGATTHHDRPEHGAPCFDCGEPLERGWEEPSQCEHERPDLRLWPVNLTEAELAAGAPECVNDITCDWGPHRHETTPERDARIREWEGEHQRCKQGGRGDVWECRRCGLTYSDDEYRLAMRAQLEAHAAQ